MHLVTLSESSVIHPDHNMLFDWLKNLDEIKYKAWQYNNVTSIKYMCTFIYLALWMTGFYTVYCNLWGQIMPYFVNSNINVEK